MKEFKGNKGKRRFGKEKQAKNKQAPLLGIIRTNARGFGFVAIQDKEEDIFIPNSRMNQALDGDTVEVRITRRSDRGEEGEVTKIISRQKNVFVGTIENRPNGIVLIPDNKKLYVPFFVPKESLSDELKKKAVNGYKALVKMTVWRKDADMPEATLTRIIGKSGENEAEIQSIIFESGFDIAFPHSVDNEANNWKKKQKEIIQSELKNRLDMRATWTCTIDPVDAKDFDDAISFKKLPNDAKTGNEMYEIGVHIADVSYYVRENTELDKEAFKRGCSIYMVDRTVPMLPEVLSNDLCSLNPGADKLAFSAIFNIDKHGRIYKKWFGRTVIHSANRFTYESAEETIKNSDAEYHDTLQILNSIAKKLRAEKLRNGAIEFEQDEVKFKLDEKGRPLGVYRKERLDSHKLVEEYMLLANKEVAKYIWDEVKKSKGKNAKGVYRIHDTPDKERISNLNDFVRSLGHFLHLDEEGNASPSELNRLLKAVEGKPEANVIRIAIIRSMQKAIYSTKNIGHFGLGFNFYTHFTSPIRRYPDLIVHRIIDSHLTGKKLSEQMISKMERIADQSTEREISAAEAERSSIKLKQVEYMSERIGQEFDGTISGVTEWGIYIEDKDTKCEGMVKIADLSAVLGEQFIFDKKSLSLVPANKNSQETPNSKKRFRLGDDVRFKVVAADLEKKILDYAVI